MNLSMEYTVFQQTLKHTACLQTNLGSYKLKIWGNKRQYIMLRNIIKKNYIYKNNMYKHSWKIALKNYLEHFKKGSFEG
jgi:hypothetical protein